MPDGLDKQIETIVDKAQMLGLVDALEDDATAILIAKTPLEDGDEAITFFHIGNPPFATFMGMLEVVKAQVTDEHYHHHCCHTEEGG